MARSDLLDPDISVRPLRRPDLVPGVIIAVVVAALLVLAGMTLGLPRHHRVTVQNPLAWPAAVSVRGVSSTSITGLGAVDHGGTLDFLDAPDQGSQWVFTFSYQGQSVDVQVDRATLAANGWKVKVPDSLGQALSDAGVPPSAPPASSAPSSAAGSSTPAS